MIVGTSSQWEREQEGPHHRRSKVQPAAASIHGSTHQGSMSAYEPRGIMPLCGELRRWNMYLPRKELYRYGAFHEFIDTGLLWTVIVSPN